MPSKSVPAARAWMRLGWMLAATVVSGVTHAASGYETQAKSAVLMEAGTGAVLYQYNADQMLPPASMSKLMTLTLLFRSLKKGRLDLDDEFVVSEHAWRTGGAPSGTAAMFVPINTKASVRELIQGIIVQSGNDAAIAVAEGMAGSEEAFAERMTARARKLGLEKSVFKNATGLYDPQHLMTAREVALLARYLINEFPEYYGMFAQKEFRYRKHRFFNRNPLLMSEVGVDGLKTGYVKDAGYGIVASAKQGNMRLIAVVMGLPSAAARRSEGRKLLEWGFRNVALVKLFGAEEAVGYARVWGGDRYFATLKARGDLSIYLPRIPERPKLYAELTYSGPLKPPIKKGEQLALLRVTSETGTENEVPLYADEDIEAAGLLARGVDSLVIILGDWMEEMISNLIALAVPDQREASLSARDSPIRSHPCSISCVSWHTRKSKVDVDAAHRDAWPTATSRAPPRATVVAEGTRSVEAAAAPLHTSQFSDRHFAEQ